MEQVSPAKATRQESVPGAKQFIKPVGRDEKMLDVANERIAASVDDKQWADKIKNAIDQNTDKEYPQAPTETREELLKKEELEKEQNQIKAEKLLEKADQLKAGAKIKAGVQRERESAELDPARKSAMANLKKLEAEHEELGKQLRNLTDMDPQDAYEKLVLNGGFMLRMKRGLAKLANDPTYEVLDNWIESGKKVEEADRLIVGAKPDFGQTSKAKSLRNRADEETVTKAAGDRATASAYRETPLDTTVPAGEVSDETLMAAVNAPIIKEKKIRAAADKKHEELASKFATKKVDFASERDEDMFAKAAEEAKAGAVDLRTDEEKVEVDFKAGVIRNAEGKIASEEEKVAKRPVSRVSNRRSNGVGSGREAAERTPGVTMYRPEEQAEAKPEMTKSEFEMAKAADINVVRKEYPRAAEIWNSISTQLKTMDQKQIEDLNKLFGTADVATAYVLDRAFADMDNKTDALDRVKKADKILGIEEVSPKKVKPKLVKNAA